MRIMYYEVLDCEYKLVTGRHAIIAPEGTDEKLLKKYDFVQLIDGHWVHFMTADETLYMKNNQGKEILIFHNTEETYKRISKQERHDARVRAIIKALVCLIIEFLIVLLINHLIDVRLEKERREREKRRKEFWSQFDCENAGDACGSQYIKLIWWESP